MSGARDAIVAATRRWIGTRYMHQASLLHVGCDCLGLVRGVWREIIGDEPEEPPPYTPDWAEAAGFETLLAAADRHFTRTSIGGYRPGDVLVFRMRDHLPAKHLGIATTLTHMVHAHSGVGVTEIAIGSHWRRRIAAAFSFPGVED